MAYWKVIVILLDPGDADENMIQLMKNLYTCTPTIRINLEGYKDAGEAPRRAIWEQILRTADSVNIDLLNYNVVV